MVRRSFVSLYVLIWHLSVMQGRYNSPVRTSRMCEENDKNLEDAVNNSEMFNAFSGVNNTIYFPLSNSPNVDASEYNNIRRFCTSYREKFENILEFKFYGAAVRNSNAHLSTCPWVLVDNYDEDRLPRVISEAKCMCSRCLERNTNKGSDIHYVPNIGRCKQVMTSVMTLRRQCNDNTRIYKYVATAERISVGCTCTSPDKL